MKYLIVLINSISSSIHLYILPFGLHGRLFLGNDLPAMIFLFLDFISVIYMIYKCNTIHLSDREMAQKSVAMSSNNASHVIEDIISPQSPTMNTTMIIPQ